MVKPGQREQTLQAESYQLEVAGGRGRKAKGGSGYSGAAVSRPTSMEEGREACSMLTPAAG